MSRAHTAAAVCAIALIPLVPLVLRVYAGVASVDRGSAVARNERVFHSLPAVAGARLVAAYDYPMHRWNIGDSMTPVDRYRTEFFLRLPRKVPRQAIVAHYARALPGWRERRLSTGVVFTHGRAQIELAFSENAQSAERTKAYAVYVSQ